MKFQNLTRKHYDDITNCVSQMYFKMKKKQFLQKLRSLDREHIYDMLNKRIQLYVPGLSMYTVTYALRHAYDFEKSMRFYIDKEPDIDKSMYGADWDILLADSDSIIVESFYGNSVPFTAELTRTDMKFENLDFEVKYRVDIYADFSDIVTDVKKERPNLKITHDMYHAPTATLLYAEDKTNFLVMMCEGTVWDKLAHEPATLTVLDNGIEYDTHILRTVSSLAEDLVDDSAEYTMNNFAILSLKCFKYAAYMYANRGTLTRKNGKASRRYSEVAVHRVHKEVAKSEDRLVALHTYVKEYEPSTHAAYKGGHHASPVEHDRRAYYRKSRGVGDYDLINGEFVKVGKGLGKYSLVRASHINGEKSSKVYKI